MDGVCDGCYYLSISGRRWSEDDQLMHGWIEAALFDLLCVNLLALME